MTWSEYRQASFTFRKGKRFKEWAGFGVVTDSKPNDDIVDILGFLTFEIVQTLTEEALKIKEGEDLVKDKSGGEQAGKKRKIQGLFDPPSEGRTPVEPRHIQEAFRRLQQRPNKQRAMCNFTRGLNRTPLKLVSTYIYISPQYMFTNRLAVLIVELLCSSRGGFGVACRYGIYVWFRSAVCIGVFLLKPEYGFAFGIASLHNRFIWITNTMHGDHSNVRACQQSAHICIYICTAQTMPPISCNSRCSRLLYPYLTVLVRRSLPD